MAKSDMAIITTRDLQAAMTTCCAEAKPWIKGEFVQLRLLSQATSNPGRVYSFEHTSTKSLVAVKCMPTKWVRTSPEKFQTRWPGALENPWQDVALVRRLNEMNFPFVCKLFGVFTDEKCLYFATSLASQGDLFDWCLKVPDLGPEPEVIIKPIFSQLCAAVRWLHEFGISHRDLSPENVLLTDAPNGEVQVQIIDFCQATLSRNYAAEVTGKPSYQAPEMHTETCDGFLIDAFSVGVILYFMALQDYPWMSTKKDACAVFDFISNYGLKEFASRKRCRADTDKTILEVMSAPLF